MNTPTEADKRAADAIYDATWGTREAIWPGVDAVAQLITDHMQPEREALRLVKEALEISQRAVSLMRCSCAPSKGSTWCAKCKSANESAKALAAIEKVLP